MKLGANGTAEYAALVKEKGFDYLELKVNQFALLSGADFDGMRSLLSKVGIPTPAANFFFPSDLKVVGPCVDEAAVMQYCQRAISRSIQLGIKHLTVGSGPSRTCPAGFSIKDAEDQFTAWMAKLGRLLEGTDCVASFEHLNSSSGVNTLNSLSGCIDRVIEVNHPNIKAMVDFQQMTCEGESYDSILKGKGLIVHAHISNSHNIHCPAADSEDNYGVFMDKLKEIGYAGNLTVETLFYDDVTFTSTYLDSLIRRHGFTRG